LTLIFARIRIKVGPFVEKDEVLILAVLSKSASEWQELLRIAQGTPLVIERVRIPEKGIAVEGAFSLPELARLSLEDQVFVTAFLRSHGSIKEMEQVFGVSYPTIKSRLNRIAGQLEFIDTDPSPSRADVLEQLNRGEITADEAIRILEASK
jgi:hypothetical protein